MSVIGMLSQTTGNLFLSLTIAAFYIYCLQIE